jgi:hypothetical protein
MTDKVLSKEERRALAVQKLAKAFGRNDTTRRNDSDEKEILLQIINSPDLEECNRDFVRKYRRLTSEYSLAGGEEDSRKTSRTPSHPKSAD